jgi:Regulator of ribonuclease activity B
MGDDKRAIAELVAVSVGDAPHNILHYIYVRSSEAAASIADELRHNGFRTEERLSADAVNWLVLARQQAVPSEALMAATRRFMEALVAKVGGEYDGWEAEVRRQRDDHLSCHRVQ